MNVDANKVIIKSDCIFCSLSEIEIVAKDEFCVAIRDGYPITTGHTLIVIKRHVASYFDLSQGEIDSVSRHLKEQQAVLIDADKSITGFNIGINQGVDAGQTVMHCHVHLIPRRTNDVDDPRGGVRGIIPGQMKYNRNI